MQVHLGHGVLWMFFYAWVKFWGEKSEGKSWIIFIIFYHVAILLNYSILRIMVSLDIGSKEFWIFSYFNTLFYQSLINQNITWERILKYWWLFWKGGKFDAQYLGLVTVLRWQNIKQGCHSNSNFQFQAIPGYFRGKTTIFPGFWRKNAGSRHYKFLIIIHSSSWVINVN